MLRLQLKWRVAVRLAALCVILTAAGGCHPSPEPETLAEKETLDVLKFESVVQRFVEENTVHAETYRRLIASTPIKERDKGLAQIAESFTSLPPVPVGEVVGTITEAVPGPVAPATEKVAEAAEASPLPVEQATRPFTKPAPQQNRVLFIEIIDTAGEYHAVLLHTPALSIPPALKPVACETALEKFEAMQDTIMTLIEDTDAVALNIPGAGAGVAGRPIVVLTHFDGAGWDAVAFHQPDAAKAPPGSAAALLAFHYSRVVDFIRQCAPDSEVAQMQASPQ